MIELTKKGLQQCKQCICQILRLNPFFGTALYFPRRVYTVYTRVTYPVGGHQYQDTEMEHMFMRV